LNPIRLFFSSLHNALKHKPVLPGFKHIENDVETNDKTAFALLWKPIRKYWKLGIAAIVLIFAAGIMAYPAPLVYRYLIDKVILAQNIAKLPLTAAVLVLIGVLRYLLNMSMNYISSLLNRNTLLYLREDLTQRVLSLPQSFFDRNSPGYIMSRIDSDLGGVSWLLSSSPLRILEDFIKLIGGLCFLYYLEWRAGLCITLILPVFTLISHFFSRRQYALASCHSEEFAKSGGSMEESISNINTVKAIAGEDATGRRIMAHYRKMFHFGVEQHVLSSFYQFIVNFFPQITRFLLLLAGGIWIINGEWTLGSLFAAQAYLNFVFSPVKSLAHANIQYQSSLVSLRRVSQFYAITPEYKPGGRKLEKLNGAIAFEDVSFGYNPENEVLKTISFTVAPGQKTAICGESGSGKSTLISLLMRFYIPGKGHIVFDGEDAGVYDLKQLRRKMGYVSQEPELFTGSIAENIRMNNPEANDEEIINTLNIAGLGRFIAECPGKINFMLEDKGANLSIGQKKRLALARTLISNPDILIFDEPTAELDNETTHRLLDNLLSATTGKTVFIITHDPVVAEFCDKSMFIVNGQIAGFAPHAELTARSPEYRELFQVQEK
jgi:ABC-type bacteriocin/lantibiotic exporter with double-glycine peptidase domain